MARFIAVLLIGPWLLVLGWLYWLYVRRRAANGIPPRFDVGVLAAAAAATIGSTAFGYQVALGHGGPIWKQVAAALAAYAGFSLVVLPGLLRHWLARGRLGENRRSRSPEGPLSTR